MDANVGHSDDALVLEPDAAVASVLLDQHHAAETNGRMSVCRRCGVITDGPTGPHRILNERSLKRGRDWLEKERQRERIDRFGSPA